MLRSYANKHFGPAWVPVTRVGAFWVLALKTVLLTAIIMLTAEVYRLGEREMRWVSYLRERQKATTTYIGGRVDLTELLKESRLRFARSLSRARSATLILVQSSAALTACSDRERWFDLGRRTRAKGLAMDVVLLSGGMEPAVAAFAADWPADNGVELYDADPAALSSHTGTRGAPFALLVGLSNQLLAVSSGCLEPTMTEELLSWSQESSAVNRLRFMSSNRGVAFDLSAPSAGSR